MCDFQAFLCEACREKFFLHLNLFKAVEEHRKHLWKHYKDLALNKIMVLLRFWYFICQKKKDFGILKREM